MLNTLITILIAAILFHFFGIVPSFGQNRNPDAQNLKIKSDLTKRGTGEKSKVKIELRDGREINGYIAEISTNDFVIADSKTGDRTTITYSGVKKVKGPGFSPGAKLAIIGAAIGIGVGIAVAASNRKVHCTLCP